jgi:hypothetical protein
MNQQNFGLQQGLTGLTSPQAAGASLTGGSWPPAQPCHAYSQTEGVSLEWRITGLKAIFEQTRGDVRSRAFLDAGCRCISSPGDELTVRPARHLVTGVRPRAASSRVPSSEAGAGRSSGTQTYVPKEDLTGKLTRLTGRRRL